MISSLTESKRPELEEEKFTEEVVRNVFEHWQIPCVDLNYAENNDPNDIPYVVLGSGVYRGCEAHYFTIADLALWIPEMLPSGDVVIYYPIRKIGDGKEPDALMKRRVQSWEFLIVQFEEVMERLWIKAKHSHSSSEEWAHNERDPEGYLKLPPNTPTQVDKILMNVDGSIKDAILELNGAGFATTESCSGLKKDHEDRTPHETYVCFDDEYYLDVSAHLFTLAEMAGWDPCWGMYGYDVLLYAVAEGEKEKKQAWKRLSNIAKYLGEELTEYRRLVDPEEGYYFYRFRSERYLFSRYYNEESKNLSGIKEELDRIDAEFYSAEDD